MYAIWKYENQEEVASGSCSLIQINLPANILDQVERHEDNKENKIYLILTCAHNVSQYSSLNEGIEKAKEIVIVFGKQQNKSVKQEFTDKIKTSLQLYINP